MTSSSTPEASSVNLQVEVVDLDLHLAALALSNAMVLVEGELLPLLTRKTHENNFEQKNEQKQRYKIKFKNSVFYGQLWC